MRATVEKFGPADFPEQPWKNGGGTTRELLRAPHPLEAGKFAWRLSCASVATSGPFSIFPGIDRTLLLLEGDGFALRCGDGSEVILSRPGGRIDFRGDDATECRLLGGPCRDFNVMVDRALFRHTVTLWRGGRDTAPVACAPLCLVYLVDGSLTVTAPANPAVSISLSAGELARVTDAKELMLLSAGAEAFAVKVDLFPIRATDVPL